MIIAEIAPTIAAVTGIAALIWSAFVWWRARVTKHQQDADRANVNAIRVTQDALAGTITLQHEDNERLRLRLRIVEADLSQCLMAHERFERFLARRGLRIADSDDG